MGKAQYWVTRMNKVAHGSFFMGHEPMLAENSRSPNIFRVSNLPYSAGPLDDCLQGEMGQNLQSLRFLFRLKFIFIHIFIVCLYLNLFSKKKKMSLFKSLYFQVFHLISQPHRNPLATPFN